MQRKARVPFDSTRRGALAAAIVCAFVLQACSGTEHTANVSTETFPTWEAYLQERNPVDRSKVVFIGLDGATWELIDPMITRGLLPNFARLKEEGAWGTLNSTATYVSPPAWTAMMTGFLSASNGIYTFGHWNGDTHRFLPLRSTDVLVPAVWDVATLGGVRTAVINVPVTYPVRDVNGIMVSGLLTPTRLADRSLSALDLGPSEDPSGSSVSPSLSARLEEGGNVITVYLIDSIDDGRTEYDRVRLDVNGAREAGSSVSVFDMGDFSPWMKVLVEGENGTRAGWARFSVLVQDGRYYLWRSHVLWSFEETDASFTFPDSLRNDLHKHFEYYFPSTYLDGPLVPGHATDAARWASYFFDYDDWDFFLYVFTQTDNILHASGMSTLTEEVFGVIDAFLGELIDRLPDDYTLILGSDHGFAEYDFAVDLNRLFEALGLVRYKNDREVDYDRSVAFHNMWGIHFNPDLLTRQELRTRQIACPDGVTPRDALTAFIREAAPRYLIDELGHDVPLKFTEVPAEAAGLPPDLLVTGSYRQYQIELWNVNKPRPDIVSPLRDGARWYHTRRGMFLIRGPGVKRGMEVPPTDIQNMTPTMLYLLGLPAPTNIEGHVIADVFEPTVLSSRKRYVVDDYAALPRALEVSEDRRQDLEKQLRGLGYIR